MTDIPPVYPDEEQQIMLSRIAGSLAHQFHPDVDRDDILQELWAKWLTDWRYISRYVYDEDEARGQGKLRRAMHNAGISYCQAEKAARRGYTVDDVFYYSLDTLRLLLPHLGDAESFSAFAVRGEHIGRSNKPAHEGGDSLALFADIESAWYRLTQPQRDVLFAVWVEPTSDTEDGLYAHLAAELEIDCDAARKRAERALRALQKLLGGPKPTDRRRAVSNAQAQSMTRAEYGGE